MRLIANEVLRIYAELQTVLHLSICNSAQFRKGAMTITQALSSIPLNPPNPQGVIEKMDLLTKFDHVANRIKQERTTKHQAEVSLPPTSLNHWLACIRETTCTEEVFEILDEFRPLSWTDQERASMSQVYMRQLDQLNHQNQSRGG